MLGLIIDSGMASSISSSARPEIEAKRSHTCDLLQFTHVVCRAQSHGVCSQSELKLVIINYVSLNAL